MIELRETYQPGSSIVVAWTEDGQPVLGEVLEVRETSLVARYIKPDSSGERLVELHEQQVNMLALRAQLFDLPNVDAHRAGFIAATMELGALMFYDEATARVIIARERLEDAAASGSEAARLILLGSPYSSKGR